MKLPSASPFFPPMPAAGSPDGSRMAKGISLTEDELKTLKGILDDMEL